MHNFQVQKCIIIVQNAIYDYSLRENHEIIGKDNCFIYIYAWYIHMDITLR